MKTFVWLFVLVTVVACKKDKNKYIALTGDCTGYYLRVDGVEYKICNEELVDESQLGKQIIVGYEEVDDCSVSGSSCGLLHPYEGFVIIDSSMVQ